MSYRINSLFLALLVCPAPLLSAQEKKEETKETTFLDKTKTQWLNELKESKNPKNRRGAVIALSAIWPKAAGVMPRLIETLESDPEAEVRRAVAVAFGQMGPEAKGGIDTLAEALKKDKDGSVREAAARSLGKLADYSFIHINAMGKALKDPHPGTCAAAAEALQYFGSKAKLVLPQLLEVVGDPKAERFTRQYALLVVVKECLDDDSVFPVLLALVQESDAGVNLRKLAMSGLPTFENKADQAVPLLAKVLESTQNHPEIRLSAAATLTKFGTKAAPAWPAIKLALKDSDNNLRLQAIRLAGGLGGVQKEAAAELLSMLEKGRDQNLEALLALIQEVGELGLKDAEPILTKLTGDVRMAVREAAEGALKKVKGS